MSNLFKRAEVGYEVVRLYNEKKSRADIAKEFGLTLPQVVNILRHARAHGIHMEPARRGRGVNPATMVRRAEIVRLYLSGQSGPAIARELGVTTETVYSHLRRSGTPRRRIVTDERNKSIVMRYQNGESGVRIATDIGVSSKVVYEALRNAGVVIRQYGKKTNA